MKTYQIDIQDPREIESACDFARQEAEIHGEVLIGLRHDHYSTVRGRSEQVKGLDEEIEFDVPYPVEINRKDGGNTWVHSPQSRCLMLAVGNKDLDTKNHEGLMERWGELSQRAIDKYFEGDTVYRGGDIYDQEGDQLAGLSSDLTGEGSNLFRMCFYEGDGEEHGKKFHELVETDLELNEDGPMRDFRPHYQPLPNVYEKIIDHFETETYEVEPASAIMKENGNQPEYCI